MTAGRPPAWSPFHANSLCAWTEPVILATKDRVPLPAAVRNLLHVSCPGRLVADLAQEGRASLRSERDFETELENLSRAVNDNPQLALAALDRFQFVPVTAEARLVLSVGLRAHLDAIEHPVIRLVVADGQLTLWSELVWRSTRVARMELAERFLRDQA